MGWERLREKSIPNHRSAITTPVGNGRIAALLLFCLPMVALPMVHLHSHPTAEHDYNYIQEVPLNGRPGSGLLIGLVMVFWGLDGLPRPVHCGKEPRGYCACH